MSIENIIRYSEELGLTSIAITPHIPPLYKTDVGMIEGDPNSENLKEIRKIIRKTDTTVKVYLGAEIDACRYRLDGSLVLENVEILDFVIGATHYLPGTDFLATHEVRMSISEKRQFYSLWFKWVENIINNPLVDVFAHLGRTLLRNNLTNGLNDGKVLCDFELLMEHFKKNNTAIEINEQHLNRMSERQFTTYVEIVKMAKQRGIKLLLGTDAHSLNKIGNYQLCEKMAQELQLGDCDYFDPSLTRKKEKKEG